MQRTSVHLSEKQLEWLRREAVRRGVSFGEVLRRIIDEKRDSKTPIRPAAPDQSQ